jgi:hypothetical protein
VYSLGISLGTIAPKRQLMKVINTKAPAAPTNTADFVYLIDMMAATKNV